MNHLFITIEGLSGLFTPIQEVRSESQHKVLVVSNLTGSTFWVDKKKTNK